MHEELVKLHRKISKYYNLNEGLSDEFYNVLNNKVTEAITTFVNHNPQLSTTFIDNHYLVHNPINDPMAFSLLKVGQELFIDFIVPAQIAVDDQNKSIKMNDPYGQSVINPIYATTAHHYHDALTLSKIDSDNYSIEVNTNVLGRDNFDLDLYSLVFSNTDVQRVIAFINDIFMRLSHIGKYNSSHKAVPVIHTVDGEDDLCYRSSMPIDYAAFTESKKLNKCEKMSDREYIYKITEGMIDEAEILTEGNVANLVGAAATAYMWGKAAMTIKDILTKPGPLQKSPKILDTAVKKREYPTSVSKKWY